MKKYAILIILIFAYSSNFMGQTEPWFKQTIYSDSSGSFNQSSTLFQWNSFNTSTRFDSLHRVTSNHYSDSIRKCDFWFFYDSIGSWTLQVIQKDLKDSLIQHKVFLHGELYMEGESQYYPSKKVGRTRINKWIQYDTENGKIIGWVIFDSAESKEEDCPQSFECTFIKDKYGIYKDILSKDWW